VRVRNAQQARVQALNLRRMHNLHGIGRAQHNVIRPWYQGAHVKLVSVCPCEAVPVPNAVYLCLCLLRISLARRPPAAITPRAVMHAPMRAAHAVGDTQPRVKCILGTRTHAVALIPDPDHAVLCTPQVCVHAQHLQHWTPSRALRTRRYDCRLTRCYKP